jgi:hypothetical protein
VRWESARHRRAQRAAEGIKAAMGIESAMVRVQMAYNSVDFAPGIARYVEANNEILRLSTSMATSYEDVWRRPWLRRRRSPTSMGTSCPQERLDDLQTSLKEAEARHKEMYGQNGLKTQYRKHPSEVMAADDRLAKLQRDIEDQKANIAHENDPNRSGPRGTMERH